MNFLDVTDLLFNELCNAENKFPDWPADYIHAAAIVSEEAGELVQAANDFVYPECRKTDGDMKQKMRREAVQTGAMAIRFLLNMEG